MLAEQSLLKGFWVRNPLMRNEHVVDQKYVDPKGRRALPKQGEAISDNFYNAS